MSLHISRVRSRSRLGDDLTFRTEQNRTETPASGRAASDAGGMKPWFFLGLLGVIGIAMIVTRGSRGPLPIDSTFSKD